MTKIIISGLLVNLILLPGHAASVFVLENGKYVYGLEQINQHIQESGLDYLTMSASPVNPDAKYKLLKGRNEYMAKDWFTYDWYYLQDDFKMDTQKFIQNQGAKDFNEAKRKQYAQFPFSQKKSYHLKTVPAMREWGGLTHPPVKNLEFPLTTYDSKFTPLDYSSLESPYFNPALQKEIDEVSSSELSFGNTVRVLMDNEAFEAKLGLIRKAQEDIQVSSLAFICDPSTKEFVDILIKKKQEGVRVRAIADHFISLAFSARECLRKMEAVGIEVLEAKDIWRHRGKAIYHAKSLVVDYKYAIAGGSNLLDADNRSRSVDFKNRDADLYVEGPMVLDIARQFLENWQYHFKLKDKRKYKITSAQEDLEFVQTLILKERMAGLRGSDSYEKILSSPESRMKGVCRFVKQAPYEDRETVGKAYLKLLDHVSDYLVITDPVKSDTGNEDKQKKGMDAFDTFKMFNKLHEKTTQLARSGKRVDYITTNIDMAGNENVAILNDNIREQLAHGRPMSANWSYAKLVASNRFFGKPHYRNLLADWLPLKGARIWTHMSFMHSKIFYFDRVVASIGSVNFHHNATDHAYESTSICMDEGLNRELDAVLVHDMANSIPLIFSELK